MQIIKKLNTDKDEFLLVGDIFQKTKVSDCYSNFGQKVSNYDAGDYLSISKPFKITVDEETTELKEGEIISADFNQELYSSIHKIKGGESDDEVTFEYEYCSAYTFWDGHNFKTITAAVENGEPTHEICEGEDFDKMISEYDTAEKIKNVPGGEILKSENFIYQKSFWQGHFEIATVETIGEYETRTTY